MVALPEERQRHDSPPFSGFFRHSAVGGESRVHDRNRVVFIDSRTLGCPPAVCVQSRRKRNIHPEKSLRLLARAASTAENRATFILPYDERSSQLRHCTDTWGKLPRLRSLATLGSLFSPYISFSLFSLSLPAEVANETPARGIGVKNC